MPADRLRSRAHGGSGLAERALLAAVLLPWWWLTAAFGGVYPWAWSAGAVLCWTAAGAVALAGWTLPAGAAARLAVLRAPWLAVLGVAAVQLLPLPGGAVAALHLPPGAAFDPDAAYRLAHPPAGAGLSAFYPDGWRAVSVRPGRTLLFAFAWLTAGVWARAAAVAAVRVGPGTFARAVAATGAVVAAVALAHHFAAAGPAGLFGWQRQQSAGLSAAPLLNPNSQAEWLLLAAGPAAALLVRAVSARARLAGPLAAVALPAVGIAALGSLAAAGGGLAAAASALRAAGASRARVAVAAAAAAAVAIGGVSWVQGDVAAKLLGFADPAAGRPRLWLLGLDLWFRVPWLGAGLDTFGIASLPLQGRDFAVRVLAPHSFPIEVLADGGVALAAAAAWLCVALGRLGARAVSAPRHRYPPVAAGAAWSLAGFAVPLLVGIPLHVPAVALSAALLAALLVADPCRRVRRPAPQPAAARALPLAAPCSAVPAPAAARGLCPA